MINIATLKLLDKMNTISAQMEVDVRPFSALVYGEDEDFFSGLVYDDSREDDTGFPIIAEYIMSEDLQEILSYFDEDDASGEPEEEYQMRLVLDDEDDPYVEVTIFGADVDAVIEPGRWYLA